MALAFSTGLHRSLQDWKVDPVSQQVRKPLSPSGPVLICFLMNQVRARLFWGLYTLDTALAYSQGRPALIRLAECKSRALSENCCID